MNNVTTGLVKKVLSDEQFELINKNLLDPKDITIIDTIKTYITKDNTEIEYLPIRVSSKEVTKEGHEKFIYDKDKNEYVSSYNISNVLYAYGKEMRILLELGEHHPVKIVYSENSETKIKKIICVQDQSIGTLE